MRTLIESKELENLAQSVIDEEDLEVSRARIKYLMVSPQLTPPGTHGKCIRCSPELSMYSEADYIIEISKQTWDNLDDKAKRILILHELLHVKIEYDEKKDDYKFMLRKHDIEDFRSIIEQHGLDWLDYVRQTKPKSKQEDNHNDQ